MGKREKKKPDKWIKKQQTEPRQQSQFDHPKSKNWKARSSRFFRGDNGVLKEENAAVKEHEGGKKQGKVTICHMHFL